MKESNILKTPELLAHAAEHLPKTVGAALIIAVKDGKVCTYIAGADPLFIHPDCIALAGTMRQLLDSKFSIANSIFSKAVENGSAEVIKVCEGTVKRRAAEEDAPEKSKPSPKEMLASLIDAKGLNEPYCMVVDEEGLLRDKPMLNIFASYLYGSHEHGQPIVGNALIMRNVRMEDGMHTDWLSKEEAEAIASKLGKSVLRAVGDLNAAIQKGVL